MNKDIIYRQAAIEAVGDVHPLDYNEQAILERIKTSPSAGPERKRGQWIEWDEDCTWECSACGEPWTLIEGTPKQNGMNYCPNCGARMMEGEEDDEVVSHCNLKENAELVAKILDADVNGEVWKGE